MLKNKEENTRNKEDKLSIFISLILRHKPETIDIKVDNQGYANVEELIKGVNNHSNDSFLDFETLKHIVDTDNKGRYSFNEDFSMIRANQGHSLKHVKIKMETPEPPEFLYHGTNINNVDKIMELGLLKGERNDVHLSKDIETALNVGKRRKGIAVLLVIKSKEMYNDNYEFRLSKNKVWLTDYVPTKYIEIYKGSY